MKHTLTTTHLTCVEHPKVHVYWNNYNMMRANCSVWNRGDETIDINMVNIFLAGDGYPHRFPNIILRISPRSSRVIYCEMFPMDNLAYVEYVNERRKDQENARKAERPL